MGSKPPVKKFIKAPIPAEINRKAIIAGIDNPAVNGARAMAATISPAAAAPPKAPQIAAFFF